MEYLTARIDFRDSGFHPADDLVASHADRDRVLDFNLLTDDSIVLLYRLRDVTDPLRDELETSSLVRRWTLVADEDVIHLYVHVEPGEPLSRMLAIAHAHPVLVERPVVVADDEVSVRLRGIGEGLQRSVAELPDSVDVAIEQTGRYSPPGVDALDRLTDRQREALHAAHRIGYYERPREATYEDLAAELDVAPTTANALLRSAENGIVEYLLGDRA